MKFKKGDKVTFSDSCSEDYRQPFKDGPREIMEIREDHPLPYAIAIPVFYSESDLKLVKEEKK